MELISSDNGGFILVWLTQITAYEIVNIQFEVISCGFKAQFLIRIRIFYIEKWRLDSQTLEQEKLMDFRINNIEHSKESKKWMIIQRITVDCEGHRIYYINDYLFTFQPTLGQLMYVFEMNRINQCFGKTKDIVVNEGNECGGCFQCNIFNQNNCLQISIVIMSISQESQKMVISKLSNLFHLEHAIYMED
ncbi:unnamed protein product [Paramecium octaurelia]|uniref:Uncharacterized protein n=1 Tax=Paramecium octaurelia TaxID=43137 RepID=A0A8S1WKU9_PAROT|nr:unnamed protein product [Paramecium octaurelia]